MVTQLKSERCVNLCEQFIPAYEHPINISVIWKPARLCSAAESSNSFSVAVTERAKLLVSCRRSGNRLPLIGSAATKLWSSSVRCFDGASATEHDDMASVNDVLQHVEHWAGLLSVQQRQRQIKSADNFADAELGGGVIFRLSVSLSADVPGWCVTGNTSYERRHEHLTSRIRKLDELLDQCREFKTASDNVYEIWLSHFSEVPYGMATGCLIQSKYVRVECTRRKMHLSVVYHAECGMWWDFSARH